MQSFSAAWLDLEQKQSLSTNRSSSRHSVKVTANEKFTKGRTQLDKDFEVFNIADPGRCDISQIQASGLVLAEHRSDCSVFMFGVRCSEHAYEHLFGASECLFRCLVPSARYLT